MKLMIDMMLHYRGYFGCHSYCGVRIYEPTLPGESYVTIYTELNGNPGTSVTNAAESIATTIWRYLEQPTVPIVFIEHYRDRCHIHGKPLFKEQFDRVTFEPVKGGYAHPRWQRITKDEADQFTIGSST